MASTAVFERHVAPARAWWLAPLGGVAAIVQALVFVYVGLLGGVLDLAGLLWRRLLPAKRIDAGIERAARAIAPAVLADVRDWPILPVLASITVLVPASAALQCLHLGVSWVLLCVLHHAVLLGAGGQRFAKLFSIKHNEAHRPKGFFRGAGRRLLSRYTEVISMFFYGNIFGLDCIHHVKVHHAEDGGPDDPQYPRGYDRTSTWSFLRYLGTQHLGVSLGFATVRYLRANGRTHDLRVFVASMAAFYAYAALLLWYNWHVAVALVIGPLFLSNLFAGLASWLQHSFESDTVADPIANTITILSPTEYLNEGFHLAHHYRSGTHWTELPQRFDEWQARHPDANPVVLDGVDWVELAILLYVRRRLDLVAERWRPLSTAQAGLSVADRTTLLRQRLGGGAFGRAASSGLR